MKIKQPQHSYHYSNEQVIFNDNVLSIVELNKQIFIFVAACNIQCKQYFTINDVPVESIPPNSVITLDDIIFETKDNCLYLKVDKQFINPNYEQELAEWEIYSKENIYRNKLNSIILLEDIADILNNDDLAFEDKLKNIDKTCKEYEELLD